MPMYLFGDEESSNYDAFPSFSNEWKWNDRECMKSSDLNKLVRTIVDLVNKRKKSEDGFRGETLSTFRNFVESDEIILLGPYQLWFYCDSTDAVGHEKLYCYFLVNVMALTNEGIRYVRVAFLRFSATNEIFELTKQLRYRNSGGLDNVLDVAVHVADVEIPDSMLCQAFLDKYDFSVTNMKEYG